MVICWNVGGLPMEVHLQSHCFYINFAIVNELQQNSNHITFFPHGNYCCINIVNILLILQHKETNVYLLFLHQICYSK